MRELRASEPERVVQLQVLGRRREPLLRAPVGASVLARAVTQRERRDEEGGRDPPRLAKRA